jgi:membrane associated rhomboid family serine protease
MFGFGNLPEITKNLIIINAIMLLAMTFFPGLYQYVSLYYFSNEMFRPWQIVTHMFTHANLMHLFFNMFSLYMFGSVLERVLGAKRFLTFYLLTGFGGAFLYGLVNVLHVYFLSGEFWISNLEMINQLAIPLSDKQEIANIIFTPMVGASGAVFGVLIGFAFFFPDTQLMLIFPPIPIKAKVLVAILIVYELWSGYQQQGNIAHFAHLGGALFGYLILKSWKRRGIL